MWRTWVPTGEDIRNKYRILAEGTVGVRRYLKCLCGVSISSTRWCAWFVETLLGVHLVPELSHSVHVFVAVFPFLWSDTACTWFVVCEIVITTGCLFTIDDLHLSLSSTPPFTQSPHWQLSSPSRYHYCYRQRYHMPLNPLDIFSEQHSKFFPSPQVVGTQRFSTEFQAEPAGQQAQIWGSYWDKNWLRRRSDCRICTALKTSYSDTLLILIPWCTIPDSTRARCTVGDVSCGKSYPASLQNCVVLWGCMLKISSRVFGHFQCIPCRRNFEVYHQNRSRVW